MIQPVVVHAAGSVELYVGGALKGTYGDIMSAFSQMTDKNGDYVIRLTDDEKRYEVTDNYTWPAVKSIKITGPSTDAFGYINIKGNNTLCSNLELEMIVIGDVNDDTDSGYCMDIQSHTLIMSADTHVLGEVLVAGESGFSARIVGNLVGDAGSEIVVAGKLELNCNTDIDKMVLEAGQLHFRGNGSQHKMKTLECGVDGWGIELQALEVGLNTGVHAEIGTFVKRGREGVLGQLQDIVFGTSNSSLTIGDVIFDQEVGMGFGFHFSSMSGTVTNVDIAVTGEFENINGIGVSTYQPISTISAYKEELALDKLFTAPNYNGSIGGSYTGKCADTGKAFYNGSFEVVRRGETYYVDRDTIYVDVKEVESDNSNTWYESGDWQYRILENGTIFADYTGEAMEVLVVPAIIDGYEVSQVGKLGHGNGTYHTLSGVKEIVIPATVTDIGFYPFLIGAADVTFFGAGYTPTLETITVSKGNTIYKSIDGIVYSADGKTLVTVPQAKKEVEIADSVTYVKEDAIYSCMDLVKLELPDSIKEIAYGSLRENRGLVEVRLPEGMYDLNGYLLSGCSSLKRVYIPTMQNEDPYDSTSYPTIGDNIFYGCAKLDEVVFLQDEIRIDEDVTELFGACSPALTVYCKTGSLTEQALKGLGLRTKSLEELEPTRIYGEKLELEVGETYQNYLLRNPYDEAFYNSRVKWTSSNDAVVTIDSNGFMKAVSTGTATITATCNGVTTSTTVTVVEKTPEDTGNDGIIEDTGNTGDGWHIEDGVAYWYENGVKQGLEGRGKEIYDPGTDAWYWLDSIQGGAVAKNKDVYQESSAGIWADNLSISLNGTIDPKASTGKWVHYDANGHMVKGWYTNPEGNTYFFDYTYGTMMKGYATIDGTEYYFNTDTGILERTVATDIPEMGWKNIDGIDYWYENYQRMGYSHIGSSYRGKEIYDAASDAWYWLDNIDGGKKAVSKDVYQESDAGEWGDISVEGGLNRGKWVRYDVNGHMIKGWSADGMYYFDPIYGTMAKGEAVIDGQTYYFDLNTGVRK